MNIRTISKALHELSSTIQTIPLFSSTLIFAIGGLSVLLIVMLLYFYDRLYDMVIYIFLVQFALVIVHYLYMNHLAFRLRKRYDELQQFIDKIVDKHI